MPDAPLTSYWWLERLYKQLMARKTFVDASDQWYTGPQPMPHGYEQGSQILARLQEMANANFCALVVDAAVERMHVQGFKVAGQISDDAWQIWQSNDFDLGSEQVFTDAFALGEASILVDPELNASGLPTITPEHPGQTIVACLPGKMSVRAAGLKVWCDDLMADPMLMATVYLSDAIVTYAAPMTKSIDGMTWTAASPRWELQGSMSGPHDLGEVPLVALPNRPRMCKSGTPEFDRILPIQRRINKTLLDRLVMQDFGAFRQKWVTGMEVPVDPQTNQPMEPFKAAVDRLWVGDENVAFGQLEADDITQLLAGIEADVKQIASIVPTPPHYLLGDLVNLSAEALKAAEASLVSRINRHMRNRSEPLESVMRLALRAAGMPSPDLAAMETKWASAEFRTEGELVDALVKMRSLNVPLVALYERWGATPQEIQNWPAMYRAEQMQLTATQNLFGPVTPVNAVPSEPPTVSVP